MIPEGRDRSREAPGVPWRTYLFLAAIFFIVGHDPLLSLLEYYERDVGDYAAAAAEGTPIRRVIFLALGGFGALAFMRLGRGRLRISGSLGWLILLFLTWATLSFTWSANPALTARRLAVIGLVTLGAVGIRRLFSLRDVITYTLFSTSVYLIIGLVAELILDTFHPLTPEYRFAGTIHPNHQGLNCALLALSSVAAAKYTDRGRRFLFVWASIGVGFLLLTRSRTTFASGVLALLVYWAIVAPRSRKLLVAVVLIVIFCIFLITAGDAALPTLGRSILLGREETVSTLTGRVPLWKECLRSFEERPLVGHGLGAFWSEEAMYDVSSEQGWAPTTCHSAYIDLGLDLGIVGVVVYCLILAVGAGRALARYRTSGKSEYVFSAALLSLLTLDGLLESLIIFYPTHEAFLATVVLMQLGLERKREP